MREIKFRAWDGETMHYNTSHLHLWMRDYNDKHHEIMQYTGLKDKNGKEIYEGDLINVSNDQTGFVEFVDGYFRNSVSHWGLHTYLSMPLPYKIPEIEVIGNRYENPELLEK